MKEEEGNDAKESDSNNEEVKKRKLGGNLKQKTLHWIVTKFGIILV